MDFVLLSAQRFFDTFEKQTATICEEISYEHILTKLILYFLIL